ncbi:MAG: hypothetical protein ACFFDN_47205 [Candidatus Hodarchaeota archaeon]
MRETTLKQINIIIIVSLLIIGFLFLSGCEEAPSKKQKIENKIYIKNGNDDGYIAIFTNSLPVPFGYITSENDQPCIVGLFNSDSLSKGNNMLSRGVFRFNISQWDNTNIKFYLKCVLKQGNPGQVKVYVVNDSDSLSDFIDWRDVSNIWYLTNASNGKKIEITPKEGKWTDVTITNDMIDNLDIENDYITIVLQLSNEYIGSNNDYYGFASIDYTPLDDNDQPYLVYVED